MVNIKRQFQSFDIILALMVITMGIFGIIVAGSALSINTQTDPLIISQYNSQITWFISGLVLLTAASFIDYQFICKFYIPIYIVNIFLLILVLFMPPIAGVHRWISAGSVTIQPSEFSKIFMIICLSKFIDKEKEKINNILILTILVSATLLPVILIYRQPSLSASLVTAFILIVILYSGNLSSLYFLGATAIIIPVTVLSYIDLMRETPIFITKILRGYQIKDRILPFLTKEAAGDQLYQTNRSIETIASGQLSGKGLYNGLISRYGIVPHADNDFIFSIIGEEFGFIGCISVLILVVLIILKCLIIANNSPDTLGRLIVSGVAGMIGFQAFVNVGVATGLLPNTGMPFPFLSTGGSSMWTNMIGIGLVINVKMSKQKSIFEE